MQTGRSEGQTEGNWVHSSSSGVGGEGKGGKTLTRFQTAERREEKSFFFKFTCAAAVFIQDKTMTTL